ncbi:MAG: creatininase family protein [Gemmatimonadetes bacterium]|nr:creatininase family protein [Gemmatimonadota bacterium]
MDDSLFLERLTSPQVAAALKEGKTTIVVPCGAVEQHGPHLPLFVDAEHGTRLGAEVARRMGNTLVAPTIRIGCSEHHMSFSGTISLEETTFQAVCRDYCVSLSRHGFRKICMLPTHGGNFRPLRDMLDDLNEAVRPHHSTVRAFTDLLGMLEAWRRAVQEESGLGARVGGHADIAESSIMLCLHPDLVQVDRAQEGHVSGVDESLVERIIRDGFHTVTPSGILGDARGMTETIGERCIAEAAEMVVECFGD